MGKSELADYIWPLRKWWWLVLLTTVLAGASSYLYLISQPAIYQSQTTLMVGAGVQELNPNNSQFGLAEQLAQTYADIALRTPVQQATMATLNLKSLPAYIVTVTPNSPLIEISVSDTDPARAQAVANELVNQLILQSPAGQAEHERQQFIVEQLTKLEASIQETEEEIERLQDELTTMFSAREIASTQNLILALQNKLSSLRANYSSLLANSQQSAVNKITVLEPAALPLRPDDQQLLLNLFMALVVGFTLGSGGAYLLEFVDDSVQGDREVRKQTGIPLLASIPLFGQVNQLVTLNGTSPAVAEAYRALRTNIQYMALTRSLRVLMITGPTPHDGKSITVANLGIVFAHAGRRVILVDADLHRPRLHQLFHVSNAKGLSTALQDDELDLKSLLKPTGIPNLEVLTSGPLPRNPSEMLGSERMRHLLEMLKAETELVILDTPPAGAVVDAAVLATQVDGILFVLRANKTEWPVAKQTLEVLQQVGGPMIGTILNAVSLNQSVYSYMHYGYGAHSTTEKAATAKTDSTKQRAVRGNSLFSLSGKRPGTQSDFPTNGHSKHPVEKPERDE